MNPKHSINTTITSQGQVTIPKKVREALGVSLGHKLTWEIDYSSPGQPAISLIASPNHTIVKLWGIAQEASRQYGSAMTQLENERNSWD